MKKHSASLRRGGTVAALLIIVSGIIAFSTPPEEPEVNEKKPPGALDQASFSPHLPDPLLRESVNELHFFLRTPATATDDDRLNQSTDIAISAQRVYCSYKSYVARCGKETAIELLPAIQQVYDRTLDTLNGFSKSSSPDVWTTASSVVQKRKSLANGIGAQFQARDLE